MRIAAIIFLFCVPSFASAAVFINEIAWMGTTVSTSNEWIELANDGSAPVDLTGWVLSIEGKKDITLSGNINAGGFYLIERTDDTTVPTVPADLVASFGTGISNTGAALSLKDTGGALINRVDGSQEWNIGGVVVGNNTTKETAQKGMNGWFTGTPTPRAANVLPQESSTSSIPDTQATPITVATATSDPVGLFDIPMYARITVQSGNIVPGAPAIFLGESADSKKKPIDNAYYSWAFGDGETGSGKTVSHIFHYPGTYSVALNVSSGYGILTASTRIKITVLPALLRVTLHDKTSAAVDIINEGNRDTDLSSWMIEGDYRRFVIPEHTMLLAGSSITLAQETTSFHSPLINIRILYPNGTSYEQQQKEVQIQATTSSAQVPIKITEALKAKDAPVEPITQKVASVSYKQTASVADAFAPTSVATPLPVQEEGSLWPWYVGVAFLGVFALLGIRLTRRSGINSPTELNAEDFEIIEGEEPY